MATDFRSFALRDGFRWLSIANLLALGCWSGAAHAGSWIIVPEVSVGETYTTNLSMSPIDPQDGWVTNLVPRIRIDGAGTRAKGYLDYYRNYFWYQGASAQNRQQNVLTSVATVEAIENWFFVDASANITQRNRSALGPVAVGTSSSTSNQVETRTTQVSPYVRGSMGQFADYLLRASSVDSRSEDQAFASTRINQVVGKISNQATTGAIGWFVDGSDLRLHNDVVGRRDDTRIRGGLVFPLASRFNVTLSGGREHSDFASAEKQAYSTPGGGFEWSPTQRTRVAGLWERRFFGTGHNFVLTHRTARTAWSYSDVREALVLPSMLVGYNPGSIYQLMSELLVATVADPVERARAVRARMNELGSIADLAGGGAVQTSRIFVDRLRQASAALIGSRNTVALVCSQRDQNLLPFSPTAQDDFLFLGSDVRQRVINLTWLHQLAPLAALNVGVARFRTDGLAVPDAWSEQMTTTATVRLRLSQSALGSIGVRRTRSTATTVSGVVHESALLGTLTKRF